MMPSNRARASRSDGQDVAGIGNGVCLPRNTQAQATTNHPAIVALIVAACLLGGCKTAKVTGEHSFATAPAGKPAVVYVSDFELGAQDIHHQEGFLPGGSRMPGRVRGLLSGAPKDPEARARQLVELMASSLLKDLTKAGFSALRLQPGAATPSDGWLVRGVFTEVQEGNRLQRALIGFGQGATDLQVITDVEDLSHGPPKPLYEVDTDATSGKTPGAAPTIVLGPYGAAARFVMAKKDLEKNVKQTASQIAEYVGKRIQEAK
jgi:hypothetical protein